jgi:hypothetical protein
MQILQPLVIPVKKKGLVFVVVIPVKICKVRFSGKMHDTYRGKQ